MFDFTINLGNIITIFTIAIGVALAWATLKNNVSSMTAEIVELKNEMKKMTDVLISIARQDERLNGIDDRLMLQGKRIDEMRVSVSRVESLRYDETQDRFNRLMATMDKQ